MIKSKDFDGKISIITAVYNAENHIQDLIGSLKQQTDQNFEWVVVDGLSTDRTLDILKTIDDLNIKIISEADFGIYDALNKGIKASSGEFYLVAGADDIFFKNAIEYYKDSIEDNIGMVTAIIMKNNKKVTVKRGPSWIFNEASYISNHSIGVLIKKSLHFNFGFYSRKFPIAADQFFIMICCRNGVKVKFLNKVVGGFGDSGVSSQDIIGTCTEKFRVQLLVEKNRWIVYLVYILKLTKKMLIRK